MPPHVPGTCPELHVGHLTMYGGTNCEYVYGRCSAAQTWADTLAVDPLDPGAGGRTFRGMGVGGRSRGCPTAGELLVSVR